MDQQPLARFVVLPPRPPSVATKSLRSGRQPWHPQSRILHLLGAGHLHWPFTLGFAVSGWVYLVLVFVSALGLRDDLLTDRHAGRPGRPANIGKLWNHGAASAKVIMFPAAHSLCCKGPT